MSQLNDPSAEQLAYERWRHKVYLQWLSYRLDDGLIPPPWGLRHHPQFFKEERRVAAEVWASGFRFYFKGHPNPLYAANQAREQDKYMEVWFLRYPEPDVLLGVPLADRIASAQRTWDQRNAPAGPTPRARADDDDDDGPREHSDTRPLTRDDFPDAEGWYRFKHEGGFTFSCDWEETVGDGPYATLHRAAHPPTKRRMGWSDGITEEQFANVYNAVAFANDRGCIMNTHLAVTWSMVGAVHDPQVLNKHERLLEALRKFLTKTLGLPAACWVWVLEKADGRGLHSHILLHVPTESLGRLKDMVKGAVATLTGETPAKTNEGSAIYIRHDDSFESQWVWFLYFMKGLDFDRAAPEPWQQDFAIIYGRVLRMPPVAQGRFRGQRVGTARALGSAARAKANFQSQWDRGQRTAEQLYISNYQELSTISRGLASFGGQDALPIELPVKPVFPERLNLLVLEAESDDKSR